MKYFKRVRSIFFTLLLLCISSNLSAYEPASDQTIIKISELSDLFLQGKVEAVRFATLGNRPIIITMVKVTHIIFDKTGKISAGSEVRIITEGGLVDDGHGKKIVEKALNTPELSIDKSYLLFLRAKETEDVVGLTSGESSVYEVDIEGRVINIDGHYIEDIKAGRIIFGSQKESRKKETAKKEPEFPAATITDLYGNKSIVRPVSKEKSATTLNKDKAMHVQQFIEKVQEGKK